MEINMQSSSSWKILIWPIGVLIIILLFIVAWQRGFDLKQSYSNNKPQNVLSISAEGKVSAMPDTAIVNLGVLGQGVDSKKVQSDAADKINKITEFVKGLGVKAEDITTSSNGLNPRYDWQNGANKIVGYESRQAVTIKIRGVGQDSEIVGTMLSGAVENGANEVYGSQFTIDDPDELRQQARKIAIAKAKQKAEELAREAGISLGKVVSISESGASGVPVPYYSGAEMGRGGAVEDKAIIVPNIELGTQEIVQSMVVVFEIK